MREQHRKCAEENRRKAGQLESLRSRHAETGEKAGRRERSFLQRDPEPAVQRSGRIPGGEAVDRWLAAERAKSEGVRHKSHPVPHPDRDAGEPGRRKEAGRSPLLTRNGRRNSALQSKRSAGGPWIFTAGMRRIKVRMKPEKYFASQEELRRRYEVIGNLSRTANGNLSGSAKLDFETYVQRRYFRQIIQAANRRLARMTSNEFILQCRDIRALGSQGQAGLDLDVYDLVNDSVRDVKSLSGGESFMAALSMALGLADIVQNTAGAVNLEDHVCRRGIRVPGRCGPGAGHPDPEGTGGRKRLVGIISHVNELKEQIDWKLNVIKTERGSRTEWSQ